MKLLSTLKSFPADNCFILTYNLDLSFFEYLLFTPLYLGGCRNFVILCDPGQYQSALEDISVLRFAGIRYVLLPSPIAPRGAFHPKLILLTNREGGLAIVTSANLTRSGYTSNWEVANAFRYTDRQPSSSSLPVFHWCYQVFDELIATSDPAQIARARLDQLYGTTPWLRETLAPDADARTWLIHSLGTPLIEQFAEIYMAHDSSQVAHLSVVSPYFDHKLKALGSLLSRFEPRAVDIYSKDPRGLDPKALSELEAKHEIAIWYSELDCEDRALHAKAVVLKTEKGVWSISGSANMSAPAWLRPAATGNAEFVVVRFETEHAYFDDWLDQARKNAASIPIDSIEFKQTEEWSWENSQDRELQISSAVLDGKRLTVTLGAPSKADGELSLVLDVPGGRRELQSKLGKHERELEVTVKSKTIRLLESPSRLWLEFPVANGRRARSNVVIITNLDSLRRFSRPLAKRDQPQIPQGLRPESYEQCLELLGLLDDLFATNLPDLDRRRSRIGKHQSDLERQMVVEEEGEYDPLEHFVAEPVRTPSPSAAEELYADYYDRLTYEELLSIVLRAVYRPLPDKHADVAPAYLDDIDVPDRKPIFAAAEVDAARAEKLLSRIESRFGTLVRNFKQGTNDEAYLEEVPPLYLLEVFIVIIAYLRIVWLDQYLPTERFLEYSFDLLTAMWGSPGEEGAWHRIYPRMKDAELRDAEERLGMSASVWVLAYLMSKLYAAEDMSGYYNLAAWVRHATGGLKPPEDLQALSESVLSRIHLATFPQSFGENSREDIEVGIRQLAERYDDHTLIAEVVSEPSSRASIEARTIAGTDNVPALLVKCALSDNDLDRCFDLFKIFLMNPVQKSWAWAQFVNINPPASDDDINKVILFYRGDKRSMEFAVERKTERDYRPDVTVKGLSRETILGFQSISDLSDHVQRT